MTDNIISRAESSPETATGYFKQTIGWFEKYSKLRKFWETRRAIKRQERLFDLPPDQLTSRNLMGPLGFNVYESTLAALPSICLGKLIGTLFPLEAAQPILPDNASAFTKAWLLEVSKIAPSIGGWITPFLPPLVLFLTAWTISWGCVKGPDSTKANRRRCRDAFLYYDGAYGLQSQALMSMAAVLGIAAVQHGWDSITLIIIIAAFALAGMFWSYFLVGHKFPKLLFALNGYDVKVYHFWHRHKPENRAPWNKYTLIWYFLTGTTVWMLILTTTLLQIFLSEGIAYVSVYVRFWAQHKI